MEFESHLCYTGLMKYDVKIVGLFILLWFQFTGTPARAQEPLNPHLFQIGGYANEARSIYCVSGPAGTIFEQYIWAWVPENFGLAYITIRFNFPANLDLSSHPIFNDLVTDVIYTDYPEGTVEWNMIIADCPSGWVKIFTQEYQMSDEEAAQISILGEFSMMRDCTFILNDVVVMNELLLNDPACPTVPVVDLSWDCFKSYFTR